MDKNASILWHYENDEELVTLFFITKHLRGLGVSRITLYLPYVPNARMDRVHRVYDVFTLKHFAEFINNLQFDNVIILDPHSNVTPALLNRVVIANPSAYIEQAIEKSKPDVLFFPDEGAMKRYGEMVDWSGARAFGIKKRDWATGQILGLEIHGDEVIDKKVLIIDDICSRGGTFLHSAKALSKAAAADIDLYITHCEDTIFDGELLKEDSPINKIYTTNSIFNKNHEKIEVFKL